MPTITTDDGCPINVEVSGREDAPALMLSNSLGTDLHMWDDQAPEFEKHFRLIRWDRRGHGKSGTTKGPYSFGLFGRDIIKIIDTLGIKKVNWCGLSMGGMDGQWLGANAPDRVEKLIFANTNFYYADKAPWADRIKIVRENGLKHIVGMNMERWFTKGFLERSPQTIARMTEMFIASNLDGYIACVEAVRDMDFRESNPRITHADACDRWQAGPRHPARRRRNHCQDHQRRQAGGARCRTYLQCRAAKGVHRRGAQLPAELAMDEKERHEQGMAKRRKVLGNEWVDRANAKKTSFNAEFQELITRYAWGEVWTRPHYDERTRRVLVLGTMIALGQWDEFRLHVRAALAEGGFSETDIKEIILQQTIYCGAPAGNHAFKEAAEVMAELAKAR